MSETLRQYLELEAQLFLNRTLHPEDTLDEDALLDRMDGCWWRLTSDERDWLNARNAKLGED
ncbi:MAG: hypothetical protein HYR92_07725 [Burkholderiales bacterium]|nr:hypothetical protein [Burkholderiales bacterium]